MFNRLVKRIKEERAKRVSQPQKERAIYRAVKNICSEQKPEVAIPAFQCACDAISKMREARTIDFYFVNRRLIPAFCREQNYI